MIDLTVYGTPRGKGRPRFVKATGRAFTDKPTVLAENEWQAAWVRNGSVRMPDGPLTMDVTAVLERPQSHWKVNGELSAAGNRLPWPTRKPDWDNLGKLISDALNGKAYRDDSQIVHVVLWKRWANPGEGPYTRVRIRGMAAP